MSGEEVTTRHRLLVVDDDESMRLLLARILSEGLKVEVQLAASCEQGLRLAATYAYDAIVLDLLMSGMGGYSVLLEIRRSSPNATTPVIIVSQVYDKDAIDSCLAAGANAYHLKPVKRAKLLETVKGQLEARRKTGPR
jgi:two-component system copper resistance phosphate regulon response regulator CusR